jgi:hypothetical protein
LLFANHHLLNPCGHARVPVCASAGRSSSGGSSSSSSSSSQDDSDEVAVRAEHAFAAPEVLAQFVQEMRGKAEELHATAVLLIVPKAAVQFPQVSSAQHC